MTAAAAARKIATEGVELFGGGMFPNSEDAKRYWSFTADNFLPLAHYILSLSRPQAGTWEPIASAPKDGTDILIAVIGEAGIGNVTHGHFEVLAEDEDDGPWDLRGGEPHCTYEGRVAGTYWNGFFSPTEYENRYRVDACKDFALYTHWMLPAAPSLTTPPAEPPLEDHTVRMTDVQLIEKTTIFQDPGTLTEAQLFDLVGLCMASVSDRLTIGAAIRCGLPREIARIIYSRITTPPATEEDA